MAVWRQLEIGAIDSYEKMDLFVGLIFGIVPLSLSCFNKYRHEGTSEQETEEVLHGYVI